MGVDQRRRLVRAGAAVVAPVEVASLGGGERERRRGEEVERERRKKEKEKQKERES